MRHERTAAASDSLEQVRERLRQNRGGRQAVEEEPAATIPESPSAYVLGSAVSDVVVVVGACLIPAVFRTALPFLVGAPSWLNAAFGGGLVAVLTGFWFLPRTYRVARIALAWTFLLYSVPALGRLLSTAQILRQSADPAAGIDTSVIAMFGAALSLVALQASMLWNAHRRR